MPFDANQFLDGLFRNPGAALVCDAPPTSETPVLTNQTNAPVAAVDANPPGHEPLSANSNPYSALIDRLNLDCPPEFVLTDEGFRLLDNIFQRVVDAQQSGDAKAIQAAVTAGERCAMQLFDQQCPPISEGLVI